MTPYFLERMGRKNKKNRWYEVSEHRTENEARIEKKHLRDINKKRIKYRIVHRMHACAICHRVATYAFPLSWLNLCFHCDATLRRDYRRAYAKVNQKC